MADLGPHDPRYGSMQTQPGSASSSGSANFNRASAPSISISHSSSQSSESRRNKTRQIIQEIERVKARKVPTRRKSYLGLRPEDERIRSTPPILRFHAEEQERLERMTPLDAKHLKTITRADDSRGPSGLGRQSPVVELLQRDATREDGQKRLVWKALRDEEHIKEYDYVKFYEIFSPDGGQVCLGAEAE